MPKISDKHPIHAARRKLILIIEDHAYFNKMSMSKAGQVIVNDPKHFALMVSAAGQFYTGKAPAPRTIANWYDKEKLALAKRHKDPDAEPLTPQQHRDASPYLPIRLRVPLRTSNAANIVMAKRLFSRGHSREQLQEMFGVSQATIYRWLPVNDPPTRTSRTSQEGD